MIAPLCALSSTAFPCKGYVTPQILSRVRARASPKMQRGQSGRAAAPTSPEFLWIIVFEGKSDFQRHLIMSDLAAFNMAARLHDLEPADLAQRIRCTATAFWIASSMLRSEEPAT